MRHNIFTFVESSGLEAHGRDRNIWPAKSRNAFLVNLVKYSGGVVESWLYYTNDRLLPTLRGKIQIKQERLLMNLPGRMAKWNGVNGTLTNFSNIVSNIPINSKIPLSFADQTIRGHSRWETPEPQRMQVASHAKRDPSLLKPV